jgi:AcrR family transcriptional regulator
MKRARRRTYHHGDLPEALLEAAHALVDEQGVSGFSLREAARRVGVDPAACYRHFRDKEAILQALARRGFTRFSAWMAEIVDPHAAPDQAIATLGHGYVAFALAHPSSFRVMFGPTGVDARDTALRGDYPEQASVYEILKRSVRGWADLRGIVVDVDAAAVSLWASVHGIACLLMDGALRPVDEKHRDRIIEDATRTLLAGLEERAAADRPKPPTKRRTVSAPAPRSRTRS